MTMPDLKPGHYPNTVLSRFMMTVLILDVLTSSFIVTAAPTSRIDDIHFVQDSDLGRDATKSGSFLPGLFRKFPFFGLQISVSDTFPFLTFSRTGFNTNNALSNTSSFEDVRSTNKEPLYGQVEDSGLVEVVGRNRRGANNILLDTLLNKQRSGKNEDMEIQVEAGSQSRLGGHPLQNNNDDHRTDNMEGHQTHSVNLNVSSLELKNMMEVLGTHNGHGFLTDSKVDSAKMILPGKEDNLSDIGEKQFGRSQSRVSDSSRGDGEVQSMGVGTSAVMKGVKQTADSRKTEENEETVLKSKDLYEIREDDDDDDDDGEEDLEFKRRRRFSRTPEGQGSHLATEAERKAPLSPSDSKEGKNVRRRKHAIPLTNKHTNPDNREGAVIKEKRSSDVNERVPQDKKTANTSALGDVSAAVVFLIKHRSRGDNKTVRDRLVPVKVFNRQARNKDSTGQVSLAGQMNKVYPSNPYQLNHTMKGKISRHVPNVGPHATAESHHADTDKDKNKGEEESSKKSGPLVEAMTRQPFPLHHHGRHSGPAGHVDLKWRHHQELGRHGAAILCFLSICLSLFVVIVLALNSSRNEAAGPTRDDSSTALYVHYPHY